MDIFRSARRALLRAVSALLERPLVRWVGSTTLLSFALGLGFAGLNTLALVWGKAPAQASSGPFAADLLSGICVTALAYAAAGAGYGLFSGPLALGRRGRWLAAGGLGVLLSAAFLATLVSSGVRWYSGSYLTLGALQFTLNSLSHVSDAATSRHGLTLLLMGTVGVALCCGVTVHLARRDAGDRHPSVRKPNFRQLAVALVLGGAALGLSSTKFRGGQLQTTPELAFVASLGTPARAAILDPVRTPLPLVPSSAARPRPVAPELAAGEAWRKATLRSDAPNVLLIMLESVAARYLGYAGGAAGVTPHLDALAAGSLQMRRTWTTATHSNYAQMAVLSSLFPRRGLGLDTYERLDYPRALLHDIAHAHGYATATISSQDESWQGMARFQDTGTPTTFIDARVPGRATVDIGTETIAADHETTTRAVEWLKTQSSRWSLYVNFQSTHFPYALPKGVQRPFKPHAVDLGEFKYLRYDKSLRLTAENRYKNALHYVDQQVGRLTQWLSDSGQLDDTLLIVTSDHGELFFEHGLVTHGRTLFEEESRVPLLVHWPRRVPPEVSERPASTLDVLPTIVDAMGLPPHPAHQGSSLLSARQPAPGVLLNIQGLRGVEGLICWPHKLTRDWASGRYRLFDLASDPSETTNLSQSRPTRTARLARVLDRFMLEQDEYHREGNITRSLRFAPRLPRCPHSSSDVTPAAASVSQMVDGAARDVVARDVVRRELGSSDVVPAELMPHAPGDGAARDSPARSLH